MLHLVADRDAIPPVDRLMWPLLEVLKARGGSARISEITEDVVEREGFSEAQQQVPRRSGDQMPMIDYRLAWARTYLKKIGAVDNSARAVWSITPRGREMSAEEIPQLVRNWKREYRRRGQATRHQPRDIVTSQEEAEDPGEEGWKEILLERLLAMTPEAFERLAQRVLREAGFRNVEVIGRSGDGGLDGVGVYRLSLVSFPVFFQCKRYKGAVRAAAVRDFRGAMAGRGEKGLLLTTGTFTREARTEATRDGAPPVELVGSDDLCELLREYGLWVRTSTVEVHAVDVGFFDQF